MATITFRVKAKRDKLQIFAVLNEGTKDIEKYTGYNLPATKLGDEYKHWNKQRKRVRNLGTQENSDINTKLDDWEGKFREYIRQCNKDEQAPSISDFRDSLTGVMKSGKVKLSGSPTLQEVIELYIEANKGSRNSRTISKYETIQNNVIAYDEQAGKPVLCVNVDNAWYKGFTQYLIKVAANQNAIINKKQSQIVTMISDFIENNPVGAKYKDRIVSYTKTNTLKKVQANKFPLYPEELTLLRAFDTSVLTDHQRRCVDAFLFACDTGLRYSDIIQLKPVHVHTLIDSEGTITYASLVNKKGAKRNDVAIPNRAMKILEQYANGSEPYFQFNNSQKVSSALKTIFAHKDLKLNRPCEVVKAQGIKVSRETLPLHDVISFHTARNTYITTCNNNGLALAYTQQNAGHADIKTTMGYQRDMPTERFRATLNALQ